MQKNKNTLSTTTKLAFTIAILLPLAIFAIGVRGIYGTFQESHTSGLDFNLLLPDIFFIAGAIIVLKKIVHRINRQLTEAASDTSSDDLPKPRQKDTRESPVWDFSHYPSFPWLGIVVTIVFFTVGSIVFLLPREGFNRASEQFAARKWPTTTGVVTHSKVLEHANNTPGFDSYKADIRIAYTVAGENYLLNEPYFGQSTLWRDNLSAYEERSRFKKNQRVTVHYKATNPEVATADVTFHLFTIVYAGIMLACFLFGGLSIYYTVDQFRRFLHSRSDYGD